MSRANDELLEVQRLAIEYAARTLVDAGVPEVRAIELLVALHADDAATPEAAAHAEACAAHARRCLDVERPSRAVAARLRTLHARPVLEMVLAFVLLVLRGALAPAAARAALDEPGRWLGLRDEEIARAAARFDREGDAGVLDPDVAASLERLGVDADVTEDALKRAHRALVRAHHPDRFAHAGEAAAEAAREQMARANVAHDRLKAWIEAGRPRLRLALARPATPPVPDLAPIVPARPRLQGWHVALLAGSVLGGGLWMGASGAPRSVTRPEVVSAVAPTVVFRLDDVTPGSLDVRCLQGGGSAREVTVALRGPESCRVATLSAPPRVAMIEVRRPGRWRCFGPETRACVEELPAAGTP